MSQTTSVEALEAQKKCLESLLASVHAARMLSDQLLHAPAQQPPLALRSVAATNLPQAARPQKNLGASVANRLKSAFDAIHALEENVVSEHTQAALSTVKHLASAVASGNAPPLPLSKKRKRTEQGPLASAKRQTSSAHRHDSNFDLSAPSLPFSQPTEPWPRDGLSLQAWIKSVNEKGPGIVQIWRPSRLETREQPLVLEDSTYLRFSLPHTLVAYLLVSQHDNKERLVVEKITAFGPLEHKLPHAQSEFAVFGHMTQFLAAFLQAQPEVQLPSVVSLLSSYKSLYSETCVSCGQLWTIEGHLPPLQRSWAASETDTEAKWLPRHILCSQIPIEVE